MESPVPSRLFSSHDFRHSNYGLVRVCGCFVKRRIPSRSYAVCICVFKRDKCSFVVSRDTCFSVLICACPTEIGVLLYAGMCVFNRNTCCSCVCIFVEQGYKCEYICIYILFVCIRICVFNRDMCHTMCVCACSRGIGVRWCVCMCVYNRGTHSCV